MLVKPLQEKVHLMQAKYNGREQVRDQSWLMPVPGHGSSGDWDLKGKFSTVVDTSALSQCEIVAFVVITVCL